jgi:hypothetical protein
MGYKYVTLELCKSRSGRILVLGRDLEQLVKQILDGKNYPMSKKREKMRYSSWKKKIRSTSANIWCNRKLFKKVICC